MTPQKITSLILRCTILFLLASSAYASVLSADGQGINLKEAKASALTALSEIIISKVESSFQSGVSVSGDEVKRDAQSVKKVASKITLKGVQYFNERMLGDEIQVTAVLDQAGVNSTIDYMKNQLEQDFTLLNREQKLDALDISEQLNAFVSILPRSALHQHEAIQQWTKEKRVLLLKHLNQGRVQFLSEVSDFTVKIDNKPIESGSFLEIGSYRFEASAEGYRTLSGEFFVSSGELVRIKLPFIKAISGKQLVLNLPSEYTFLKDDIVDILWDMGITLAESAKNSLHIKIKDKKRSVDEYTAHKIRLRIEAHQLDDVVKKVTLKQQLTLEKEDQHRFNEAIRRMTRKGIVGLMSRIDLESYFAE